MAAVAGPLLLLIDHANRRVEGGLSTSDLIEIGLAHRVPYLVSTCASVLARRDRRTG
jgi:hypothetical protein